jgi:hypothetical protein
MTDGGLATPSRKVVVSNKAVAKLFPPTDRNSTGTLVAVPAEASVLQPRKKVRNTSRILNIEVSFYARFAWALWVRSTICSHQGECRSRRYIGPQQFKKSLCTTGTVSK